jgi:hypothetical protein
LLNILNVSQKWTLSLMFLRKSLVDTSLGKQQNLELHEFSAYWGNHDRAIALFLNCLASQVRIVGAPVFLDKTIFFDHHKYSISHQSINLLL